MPRDLLATQPRDLLAEVEPDRAPPVRSPDISQFIAGLNDVTGAIASVPESLFGTVSFGPEGIEFLGPKAASERREAGGFTDFPGAATEEPTSLFGKGLRVAGQTAALGPILGRAAGLVKAPVVAITRIGRIAQFPKKLIAQAGETFARSPVASTLVETGLGFTAGGGGFVAQQIFPDSDTAVFVGEIMGGTAPAVMPMRLAIRAGGGLRNIYQTIKHPFTEIGGKRRAAARMQRAATPEQRAEVFSELEKPTTIDPDTGKPVLSPSQRSGVPGPLSLERAVMESSEELKRAGDIQIAQANVVIQKSLSDLGGDTPTAAEVPIKEAQQYLSNLLETRVRIAAQRTDERIAELGPKASREQLNIISREEIERALTDARIQENEFFSIIPESTAVPFNKTKSSYDAFVRQLGKPSQGDIPAIARRFLSKDSDEFFGKNIPKGFQKTETRIKELRALQSKLRETARNARVGDKKNLNKARIADELADSINDDLANVLAGPEVAKQISIAVAFSRDLNRRFNTGTVAKILGRRAAGERVPAGLTLEESIGVTGPKAREAMDDLLEAIDVSRGPSPGTGIIIDSAEDFTRARFLQEAVIRGEFNTIAAQRFIVKNNELLTRLPNVRRQIDEAIESGETLALTQRQQSRVSLDDHKVSKATMLIAKGPVETFRQISRLKPEIAAIETQKLINRVSSDATGEALAGLKAGYLEFLYSTSRQSARDVRGTPFISGFALRDALETSKASANRIFTKEEFNRLNIVIQDLIRLEKRLSATMPAEGILGDTPSKVYEVAARMTGARLGSAISKGTGGGGPILIPAIMSKRLLDLANAGVSNPASRLLRDMIFDEELFKELMQSNLEEGGTKLSKVATRRLNAWTASVIAEYGGAFEENEETP